MKKTTFTLFFFLSCCSLAAQCPTGNITFSTQGQIDSFQINYPGCKDLPGDLTIQGDDIANLNGLLGITSVGGRLRIGTWSFGPFLPLGIYKGNDSLQSLAGLDSLRSVGSLGVYDNDLLTDLSGLNNLSSASEVRIHKNGALGSLSGLKNLSHLYVLDIRKNTSLKSLTALSSLVTVRDLSIYGLDSLTSLAGLGNLDSLDYLSLGVILGFTNGGQYTSGNSSLTDLTALENVVYAGHLIIAGNSSLTQLSGLENLSHAGSLTIAGNSSLTYLNGLDNLKAVDESIEIWDNPKLKDLSQLKNVTSLTGNLEISSNESLTSLSGLQNLVSVGGDFIMGHTDFFAVSVLGNASLVSLNGLENLTTIGGRLFIYRNNALETLCGLNKDLTIGNNYFTIVYNSSLSTCHVEAICEYLSSPPANIQVNNNAPGCNSQAEIETACSMAVVDCITSLVNFPPDENGGLLVFPNPVSTFLAIRLPENLAAETLDVRVYDAAGKLVIEKRLAAAEETLDLGSLFPGIYALKAVVEGQVFSGNFIKMRT